MLFAIIILCIASAIIGRLVLTREQAIKTITVRLPASVMLLISVVLFGAVFLLFGALCFVGGSFYGVYTWWLPKVGDLIESSQYILNPVITGRWE